MNEQWNKALDQVEDEYLAEAVGYRRKRHWPGVAGAVAAVLVLAVGWSILNPGFVPTTTDPVENVTVTTEWVSGSPQTNEGTGGAPQSSGDAIFKPLPPGDASASPRPPAANVGTNAPHCASDSTHLDLLFEVCDWFENIPLLFEEMLNWLFSKIT